MSIDGIISKRWKENARCYRGEWKETVLHSVFKKCLIKMYVLCDLEYFCWYRT